MEIIDAFLNDEIDKYQLLELFELEIMDDVQQELAEELLVEEGLL